MNEFVVRWSVSGYIVDFYFCVVAESFDAAKQLWQEYVSTHGKINYTWKQAEKAMKNHYGGYISWEDHGATNKQKGCYAMKSVKTFAGSDHLWD